MNTDEAIESLRQSLAEGDKLMKSETWSGGGFKSAAVRQLIAAASGLRQSVRRIEELATDTPTHDDAVQALDDIKGECERILSDT